jgi:O-antigen ligase
MKILKLREAKSNWTLLLPIFIGLYLLFSMISISISQIFISLALICWIFVIIRKEEKFTFPSFFWPVIAYIILSLVSSFLSVNPKLSLKDSRELLLFLIVPIVYVTFASKKTLKRANFALLLSGSLNCIYAISYFLFKYFSLKHYPNERITGFIGHWMTQAGLLLLFSCMALSMFLFSSGKVRYLWGLGFLLSLIAITLTLTRNAWVGLVCSISLILLFYKPRALIIVPFMIGFLYLLSPQPVKKRALSIFNPEDPNNKSRIELFKVGMKVIRDYPLFGTGPDTVDKVFQNQKYGLSDMTKMAVHLHNDILQTGAERGIPALVAWMTFIVWVFLSLLKLIKNKDPSLRPFTIAALAALLGLFIAGLFEYNFADSEITMLFLYLITIPFSLARILEKTEPQPV